MQRVTAVITAELKKKIWNSPLQLLACGFLLFYVAMVLGSGYACGPGNTDLARGVFRCTFGEMQVLEKLLILTGMAAASLCLGRAVSLFEKRRYDTD